jgi:hypothetical protein
MREGGRGNFFFFSFPVVFVSGTVSMKVYKDTRSNAGSTGLSRRKRYICIYGLYYFVVCFSCLLLINISRSH